jgi:hypothetical protein
MTVALGCSISTPQNAKTSSKELGILNMRGGRKFECAAPTNTCGPEISAVVLFVFWGATMRYKQTAVLSVLLREVIRLERRKKLLCRQA